MPRIVRFDCFELDLESGRLRKCGSRVMLREQSFQALALLLEHPGRVVTRQQLRERLWHNEVFVDFDNNLNLIIAQLRGALGDSVQRPRFIETLPKRGYRFVAEVSESSQSEREPRLKRLIVLPFLNLSGDPVQEYFSDGITDEIITELASVAPKRLAVIARTTSMMYKMRHRDVATIRRTLSVDYVVEGSIRQTEKTLAINVQLIQANDQTHLFAKKYEGTPREIFELHSRITHDLVAHLPELIDSSGSEVIFSNIALRKPTSDLIAYNEYIQARHHLAKATPESATLAKQHLETAITRDPKFALAHDAFAEVYWYLGYTGFVPPRQAFSAGIIHALRAVELDNTRAETHALLGEFHKTLEYNWAEVHREMALALELDPNSPLVRMRYAVSELMPHGNLAQAVEELRKALDLDPLSVLTHLWMGILLTLARRDEDAIEQGKRLLDLDPTHYIGYFILANGYRYQGRLVEALAAQRKAVELSGGAPWMLGWMGLALAHSGDSEGARNILQQLHRIAASAYVPASSFGLIHLGLKEIDATFEWLNRAVDECDQLMMPIKSYAFFDPIRSDPRFGILLRKMNLYA